ncbi:uncharacterized protein isoform X2 [Rhodnius prolixus]|uniref:uncharacterized protein isoform X2 n=1 Tax=Rhodnius prolixus TaxID=13249 RepID=UPI003D18EB1C
MWDWRQLRWANKFGWWPKAAKTKYGQQMSRYWGLFLFAFDFSQLIPEFIALYTIINEGSLKGTVTNLTTTLLGVLCAARVYFLIQKSDEISLLIDSFAELDSNILHHALGAEGKTIMANGDRRCKIITYTLVFGVISLLHWLLRPLILLLSHNVKTTIIDIWVPWSFDNLGGWSAIYFVQIVHVLSAVLGSFIFDSLFFCFSEMLITQLSLLSLALTKIDFRKSHTIKLNRDLQAKDIELITLDKCIEFHCKLLRMVKVITQIYDVIQILQFVSLAAVICLSIFEASSMDGVTLIKVINLIEMMITFVFFMFMYCYYSTMLVEKYIVGHKKLPRGQPV